MYAKQGNWFLQLNEATADSSLSIKIEAHIFQSVENGRDGNIGIDRSINSNECFLKK